MGDDENIVDGINSIGAIAFFDQVVIPFILNYKKTAQSRSILDNLYR